MISLSDVTMRFGTQVIYENVTWRLNPGTRYGLVGANGTGKSTLIKLMSGELKPESGDVSRPNDLRIGMLAQDHFQFDSHRLIDVVLMGKPRLWKAIHEKEALLARHGEGALSEQEGHRLGELEVEIADQDGYTAEALAGSILEGLGLHSKRHHELMSALSGGYRLRVLLAQTLFQDPELLLLDEPTNHLDIISIRWLEDYLRNFPGTLVLVSHDRHFLNAVCNTIADVDYQELRLYTGNYDQFESAKLLAEEQKGKEIARTEKKIAEMQQFIDRFKAKASKARQASSRQKQVDRMEFPEITRTSRRYPSFAFKPLRDSGKEALRVRGVSRSYGEVTVLRDVSFEISRGERVAVVGTNGIGKSTLLKLITSHLKCDQGEIEMGYEVQFGYFAQEHSEIQGGKTSVYEWLYGTSPHQEIGTIRGTLGRVLFSAEEVDKQVNSLSGGEATRLRLAALMLKRDNMLILDEPTNHLDLEGREALLAALAEFPGTLIFVSHDRHFVSTLANRILALTPEGIEDYHGSYEEYLRREGTDFLTVKGAEQKRKGKDAAPSVSSLSQEERKARKKELGKMRKKVDSFEREVAGLEREIEAISTRFGEDGYFQNTPHDEIQRQQQDQQNKQKKLEELMAAWEAAAGELEALGDVE